MRALKKRLGYSAVIIALMAGLSAPAMAQAATDVEFGDDTSEWANDGECDDPRFTGTGMAVELEDADILRDATDCRTLFEAGDIALAEEAAPPAETTATTEETAADEPAEPAAETTASADIDFGDDTSEWANDGECDDPRFGGTAMAEELEDIDIGKDASDCQAAFEAGNITLLADGDSDVTTLADIDFGDDSSEWANDQECDDPRFAGTGMASTLEDANISADATDCRAAFEAGTITLAEDAPDPDNPPVADTVLTALANRIEFGDDGGDWPNDDECDDPDFTGPGVAASPSDINRLGDATDCRAAFIAGEAWLKSGAEYNVAFDYGTDSSQWANDGQCDDWRFTGAGMAKKLSAEDVMADATDCQTLEASGEISIIPVYEPSYILGAPYDSAGVNFGDDSSSYANDGFCDDPRFVGPGTASTLLDSDLEADATDCRTAFEQGKIVLRDGEA
jgi:hypothetical protein